ncbi:MAG TPA: hypothetical protein P5211_05490, partial [Anaerolineae bacterium]|nr:hypothetical protein [Anaerolineae bacterium]
MEPMEPVEIPEEHPTPAEPPALADFETLMARHAQLERQQRQNPDSLNTETIQALVAELRALSASATGEERQALEAAQRRWTAFLELRRAMAANRRGGIPVWALMLLTVAGMIVIAFGVSWMLRRDVKPTVPPPQISLADLTPTPDLTATALTQLAMPTSEALPPPTPTP